MTGAMLPIVRIGQGWDLHRLDDGGPLRLGGIDVPFEKSSRAHSDGDVVLHALTDAILGAVGAGDIGTLFPEADPQWKGADSAAFVREAVRRASLAGCRVGSVDVTVILERPKLQPHREAMVGGVARLLEVEKEQISLKAKTNEGLGAIGSGDAVAALVLVGLVQSSS